MSAERRRRARSPSYRPPSAQLFPRRQGDRAVVLEILLDQLNPHQPRFRLAGFQVAHQDGLAKRLVGRGLVGLGEHFLGFADYAIEVRFEQRQPRRAGRENLVLEVGVGFAAMLIPPCLPAGDILPGGVAGHFGQSLGGGGADFRAFGVAGQQAEQRLGRGLV